VVLWRISNHPSLAGYGALRTSGRWHTRGKRVVYCAQSPAAALLEILVHFVIEIRDLPARYRLLKIEAPDDVRIERITAETGEQWECKTRLKRVGLNCRRSSPATADGL
jgi:RES domain-containing protein